jgi:NADH-quinone oxidoreductase subunit N
MGKLELIALLPIIVISASAVVVMLLASFKPQPGLLNGMTLVGLLLTLAAMVWADELAPLQVTPLLIIDRFALFYSGLAVLAGMVVTLLSGRYLATAGVSVEQPAGQSHLTAEYYILLLTAILGAMVLVSSRHFASFFIGLELLGVSLYVLVAYLAPFGAARATSLEAGMKYLILSGVASALLLFGIALMYAEFGVLEFAKLGEIWSEPGVMDNAIVAVGLALLLSGSCFKLSLIPFHMWTPDVYEGAPAPITAFVATVSKGAIFAFVLRLFADTNAFEHPAVCAALTIIAILSMVGGNLLALLQNNVKRLLAYSSIAHIGYLLVVLLAGSNAKTGTALVSEAVGFYLVAYFVTTLGAFGVVTVLSKAGSGRDCDRVDDYRGLFWRAPGLAIILATMLLSLAGIPLTVGFIGKFYIVVLGVQASMWMLLAALVLGSVIGLYYYLRLIVVMFLRDEKTSEVDSLQMRIAPGDQLVLVALVVMLVWLGVSPDPVINLIQAAGLSRF